MRWQVILALVAVGMLMLAAACGTPADPAGGEQDPGTDTGDEEPAPEPEDKPTIVIYDGQWQTLWLINAIAQYVIEEGYDYPTEIVVASTPVMQQATPLGDIHLVLETWYPNLYDWYSAELEAGTILDVGPIFEEAAQGWYVPRYVIEGDPDRDLEALAPDLRSVTDLPDYWEIFKDPEDPNKGVLINCITGWQCAEINRTKVYAYGLDQYYNTLEPGAGAALDAAIIGAYRRGEPVLAYYWEPTWLLGTVDMVRLEEPAFTEECNAEIQRVLEGEIDVQDVSEVAGCAYDSHPVTKVIYAGLPDLAPDIVRFVEEFEIGNTALSQTAAYMEDNESTAEEAALWFFANFESRWRSWLPAEVAERVAQALARDGVDLGN